MCAFTRGSRRLLRTGTFPSRWTCSVPPAPAARPVHQEDRVKTGKKYGLLAGGIGLAAVVGLVPGSASAGNPDPFTGGVEPAANPRAGVQDNVLVSGLDETSVAWGQLPLTNPDAVNGITHYGYNTSN